MNDLGELEITIKPSLENYFLYGLAGFLGIATAIFFPSYLENWVWVGIPLIWVAYIAGPLLIIISIFYYFQCKNSNENIELHKNGVQIGEFVSLYTNSTLCIKKGLVNKVLIFENLTEKKIFKFPLKTKELTLIVKKFK